MYHPFLTEKKPKYGDRRFVWVVAVLFLHLTLLVQAQTVFAETNHAVDFPGSNTYVTLGNPPELGLPAFTIEGWFKWEGGGTTASTGSGGVGAIPLVTKGRDEADGDTRDMNYFLGIRASGNLLVADFEEGSAGSNPGLNHPVIGVTPLSNGVWYHAAATYDGSKWQLFLNGVMEAELIVAEPPRSDSLQHAALGTTLNSLGDPEGFFEGVIDEVRIWNHARTVQQIQNNMNRQITDPDSEPGLVARWGFNEGTGTSVSDSTANAIDGTIIGTNWNWVAGAPFNLNLPPDPPILIAPTNDELGVSTSPPLEISVSDPDNDDLTVTFRGKAVSAPVQPDFTIIALPDTQYYSQSFPEIFEAQTQWIVDNQEAMNIVFVTQLGDCVENGDGTPENPNTQEWLNADLAMSLLEGPVTTMLPDGIPYGIPVGNHDQGTGNGATGVTTLYNEFFGESRFQGRLYYGGHFGTKNDNHFELFSTSGMDFIVIHLEYDKSMDPNGAVLVWADDLLKTYSDRRAIVISHHIIGSNSSGDVTSFGTQGQAVYDALKDNANLFLMLAGHVFGEGRRQDAFNGNTVHTLLSNYQTRANGGDGWLRILEFSPANNEIWVKTYSPWLDQFETDSSSEFVLTYDMQGSSFTVIASNANVPSDSTTSTVWGGLSNSTDYEWNVTVSDGIRTTTGPTWRFTTQPPTLPNTPTALSATPVSTVRIDLAWMDNSANEATFEIERSESGVAGPFSVVATVAADTTGYADTGLAPMTEYCYRVRATNIAGSSDYTNITCATTPANRPPVLGPIGDQTVAEDQTAQLTVTATDPDGDPLTYTWTTAQGTITGTGDTVIYTPPDVSTQQTFTITVEVSDGQGGSATGTVDVTVLPVGGGGGVEMTYTPVADTYVRNDKPGANFGSATKLKVDGSPTKITYLRFTVTGLSGAVQSARLRLEVVDASAFGGTIYSLSDSSWDEGTVTFRTRPVIDGPALDALGRVSVGDIVELDVTAAITGNGTYSFAMDSNNSGGADYRSREALTNPPALIITTNGQ